MKTAPFASSEERRWTVAYRKKKIRYVDGFAIRNVFPDLDVIESFSTSGGKRDGMSTPFIPENEIWIDRRFRKEKAFLLELHRIEQLKQHWPYAKVRSYLKEKLCRKGTPPDFVVRTRRHGRLTLKYVRGEIVRRYIDPCFIFGGHDLVYPYVPKNEVWIDVRQDPREIPYTLFHELHERALMAKGWSYADAHKSATVAELKRRKAATRSKPLRLTPFRQRPSYCGPASLKIACSFFGRDYDELRLGELCGTTFEHGTDHSGIIAGAKALGATVFAKSGGTIAELRRWTGKKRLPVIIGWFSPSYPHRPLPDPAKEPVDDDHFSVVYHVSDTHVLMMDPESDRGGRRRMPIERFKRLWWDTDGPGSAKVERWYMVVNFDGKKPA
jgi:predicted double-glycine peptidase